jgi:hypothetical protein
MVADIPDPILRAVLHAKTGVPAAEDIYVSDLKALTGDLDLHGLGIANAEGLQYCTKVKYINLEVNELTDMPDFSNMNELFKLNLAYNGFTTVPDGLFDTPGLKFLFMNHCPVTSVDSGIAGLTKLIELDLSNTELDAFPAALFHHFGSGAFNECNCRNADKRTGVGKANRRAGSWLSSGIVLGNRRDNIKTEQNDRYSRGCFERRRFSE